MDKQMKDKFCELIDTELEKISKMPSLNDASLENLNTLIVTKEKLLRIEEIENKLKGGNYEDNYRGNSFDNYNTRGNSYDRSMGNGNSRRPIYDDIGYSRNDPYSHLEAAMREARTEQEREEIRQLMSRMR